MRLPVVPWAALLVLTVTNSTAAQTWSARGTLVKAQVERPGVVTDSSVALSGTLLGLHATFRLGPVALGVRYAQGGVSPASGAPSTTLVDGELIAWVAPLRWAQFGLGPHARAFVHDQGNERWLFWELRARTGRDIVGGTIRAYIEGWRVLGASVPGPDAFGHGWGMEGGLTAGFGGGPFSAQLLYRVEQQVVADGARKETQSQLALAIGVGRP